MTKKLIIFLLCVFVASPVLCDDDPFDVENFAIQDSGEPDVIVNDVAINPDAGSVGVGGFDIAGIMLGMQFEDVRSVFMKTHALYAPRRANSIIYTIPQEWKYNLDYECRSDQIYAPADLEQCINSLAKNRGLMYASELHLVRENTGETITVYFTSNATDNVVWRVVYKNDVNDLEGDADKFANQRDKKILAFWQGVLDKYGAPNSGTDKWVSTTNAYDPMMTAYYGGLDLVDNGRNASDAAINVKQARINFRAKPYAF